MDNTDRPLNARSPNIRIGVVGGAGFVGAHVLQAAQERAHQAWALPGFRVESAIGHDPFLAAQGWRRDNTEAFEKLCSVLEGIDVVVDAAGLAQPGGRDRGALFAANAVHLAVVALAAGEVNVRRLVQVSSAVVQGRLNPLDETSRHRPLSPYAESKVAAERLLFEGHPGLPPEIVVYRPTSVVSSERRPTQQLARLANLPFVPVIGDGGQPLPVSLIQNVAAGILFAATMDPPPPIVLQPSEGITARMLLDLFGARRVISLPARTSSLATTAFSRLNGVNAPLTALARQLEVVWLGQRLESHQLQAAGFVLPVGHEGWVALGQQMRRTVPVPA